MRITKIAILSFILLMSFTLHKYYVSITEIVANEETKTLEVSARLFINDLDDALFNSFNKRFELGTSRELAETDKYLKIYFMSHFQLKINDEWVPIRFIGKDFDGYDIVYCYFEVSYNEPITQLEIKNTSLLELFSEQENIIKLNINGLQKSLKLTKQKQSEVVKY